MVEAESRHPIACLPKHRRRDVDAEDGIAPGVAWKRKSRADDDLKDAAPNALGRFDCRTAPRPENTSENKIVNWRPSIVGLDGYVFFTVYRHHGALQILHLDAVEAARAGTAGPSHEFTLTIQKLDKDHIDSC